LRGKITENNRVAESFRSGSLTVADRNSSNLFKLEADQTKAFPTIVSGLSIHTTIPEENPNEDDDDDDDGDLISNVKRFLRSLGNGECDDTADLTNQVSKISSSSTLNNDSSPPNVSKLRHSPALNDDESEPLCEPSKKMVDLEVKSWYAEFCYKQKRGKGGGNRVKGAPKKQQQNQLRGAAYEGPLLQWAKRSAKAKKSRIGSSNKGNKRASMCLETVEEEP